MTGMNRSWTSRRVWLFATLALVFIAGTMRPVDAFARASDEPERSEADPQTEQAFRRAMKKQGAPWYQSHEDQIRYLPTPKAVEHKQVERKAKKRGSLEYRSKPPRKMRDYNALMAGGLKIFLWIVIILALGFCAVMAFRAWKRRQLTRETLRQLKIQRERQFQTLTPEAQSEFDDLLGAILRMTAQRDWRKAIIYYFSWLIVESDAAGQLVLDKGKTNLEYWHELQVRPKLAEIYMRVMSEFERVYFGNEAITEEQFISVAKYIDDVIEILQPLEEERVKELAPAALEAAEESKPAKREFAPEEAREIQRLLGDALWTRIQNARNLLHTLLIPLLVGLLSVSLLTCGCSGSKTPTWKASYGKRGSDYRTSQPKSINGLGAYRDYLKKERHCKVDIVYLEKPDDFPVLDKYDAVFWLETEARPLAWNAPRLAPLDQRVDAALRCLRAYDDFDDAPEQWYRWILPAVNADLEYLFWQNSPERIGDYGQEEKKEEEKKGCPLDYLSNWMNAREGRVFCWILSEYNARQDYLEQSIDELEAISKDPQTQANKDDAEFIDYCLTDAVELLQTEVTSEQRWELGVVMQFSQTRRDAQMLQKLWKQAPDKLAEFPDWGVTEDALSAYRQAHGDDSASNDARGNRSDVSMFQSVDVDFDDEEGDLDEDEIEFDDDVIESDGELDSDVQKWLDEKQAGSPVAEQLGKLDSNIASLLLDMMNQGYRSRLQLATSADLGYFWAVDSPERERFQALVPYVRYIPREERLEHTALSFSGQEDWTRNLTGAAPLREFMRFYPSAADTVLLEQGVYPIVARRDYQQGRLFFLNSSSFLCNYGLTESTNRVIAARIAEEIPYKSRVAIVLTNGKINGYPNANDFNLNIPKESRQHGEFSLTRLSPFTLFFWHVVALSSAVVLALWPIYGRARRSVHEKVNDLGLHVNAVARILARTDARQWCWDKINQFMRHYRGVDLELDQEETVELPSESDAASDTADHNAAE